MGFVLFGMASVSHGQLTYPLTTDDQTILDDLGDMVSFASDWTAFQTTISEAETAIGELDDLVSDLCALIPGANCTSGLVLSESDANLSALNEMGSNIIILTEVEGVPVLENIQGEILPVTIIVPTLDEGESPQAMTLITNPVVWSGDDWPYVPGYESENGNPWGQLWINPTLENPNFLGMVNGLTASNIGLANVDNTSDLAKPISSAAQLALDSKVEMNSDTPDSSDSPCNIGEMATGNGYLYVCIAPNNWKRTALDSNWQ